MLADVERQGAGVDAVNAGHVVRLEIVVQAPFAAPVAGLGQIADHETGQEKPARLGVLGIDAVVADLGRREHDELAGVGRIRENLLVAGHPRVEDDLAQRVPRRAEGDAAKDRAVVQRQKRAPLALGFPFRFEICLH